MNLEKRVNKLLNEGYEFKLEKYILTGYAIFKKEYGLFIGFSVVAGLIALFSGLIPIIGAPIQAVMVGIISLGYFYVARKIKIGEKPTFEDFFEPFKAFGNLIGIALVVFALTIIGIFLFVIPGIYVGVAWGFALPIMYFYSGIGLWDSMEASRRVITKNWWWFLALGFCLLLINLAGALCLLVGLLVTIPTSHLIMYAAFDDIMRPDEKIEPSNDNNETLPNELDSEQV